MKKNSELTIYSYLMDVLTSINLYKFYQTQGKENNFLEDLKTKTLQLLGKFEEIDNLDPRSNIGLNIKVLIKINDAYLFEKKKNKMFIPTFSPSISQNIEDELIGKLNEILEIDIKEINLLTFINLAEMDIKINKPEYCVIYFAEIDITKIKQKNYVVEDGFDNLNHIDKLLIERMKTYVNTH